MVAFSLEKLKSSVGRRFSDPSDFDRASVFTSDQRRESPSNLSIHVSETGDLGPGSPPNTNANMARVSSSFSLHGDSSRSRSRSRSISVSKKQAKELIRYETSQVVQKKLFSLLKELGLQSPIPLKTSAGGISAAPSKSAKIYVANSNDCVYLAPSLSTSFTYEDDENGGNQIPESDSNDNLGAMAEDIALTGASSTPSSVCLDDLNSANAQSTISDMIAKKMQTFKSANYLRTRIDSSTSIPHLFAVIVELQKDSSSKVLSVEFSSTTKIQWPTSDTTHRHYTEEKFKIGKMEWDLNFQDADLFINIKNSTDTWSKEIDPQHLAERTREYKLFDARVTSGELQDEPLSFSPHRRLSIDSLSSSGVDTSAESQKAGLYVFLLPILLPPTIPATINTVNGTLAHKLSVRVHGAHDRLSKKFATKATYTLPMVRTPPSLANSTADKPIHVNRVWNDSLHYSITFPRKYISLGSEHTINVKLIPLAKNVSVKRIKFNILERVNYVSRDMSCEYDFDGDDPLTRSRNSKAKERVVPLCELRTKSKTGYSGAEPFKEEVLICPENNLLYSCYEQRPESSGDTTSKEKSVMVASPLDINIALPFLTSKADTAMASISGEGDTFQNFSPLPVRKYSASHRDSIASLQSPSSPVIGSLETHISHLNHRSHEMSDEDVLKLDSSSMSPKKYNGKSDTHSRGYTTAAKALSPDSNFRHVKITHRLQVSFRISKPDPSDNNKMHHYEVVIDTPIILLSAKCNESALQLPEYNLTNSGAPPQRPWGGINFRTPSFDGRGLSIKPFNPQESDPLPTFEEATSSVLSPEMRSTSLTSLDPSTPSFPPAYEKLPASDHENDNDSDNGEVVPGTATIDNVLVDSGRASTQRKSSDIRTSLQNSFAPSLSYMSQGSSSCNTARSTESSIPSSSRLAVNHTFDDNSSSESPTSGIEISGIEDENSSELLAESEIAEDSTSENAEGSTSDLEFPSVYPSESADLHSQDDLTQEAPFIQRLPLLRNESTFTTGTHTDTTSARSRPVLRSSDWSKMSIETLNDSSKPQTLYHAY